MFTREIKIEKAWDSGNPKQGQRSAELRFILRGPDGTILFAVHTGWYLNNEDNITSAPLYSEWHGHRPVHEDDHYEHSCDELDGKPCYHGLMCNTTELFDHLVANGSDGLFEELEVLYHELFDKTPNWLIEPYEQMACSLTKNDH